MRKQLNIAVALALLLAAPTAVVGGEVGAEGWYGFKNSSPQNREVELLNACAGAKGDFRTINRVEVPPEKGITFDKLCEFVGLKCLTVCGWDGSPHPCDEKPSGDKADGNRVARCVPAKSF